MEWTLPGTVLSVDADRPQAAEEVFSSLFLDGSAGELIHPFFPPEKQCHGSRPGMAADGGSDAVDLDFSVQIDIIKV